MRQGLQLKPLGPADESALTELFAANDIPSVTRWFDPFPLDAETARKLCAHRGRDLYWGLWDSQDLLGIAMVRGWDGGYPQRAYGMLVDHRQHGRGLGTAATALMLDELRIRGEREVRARVHDDNVRSIGMLRANGFEEIERADGRVLLSCRVEAA